MSFGSATIVGPHVIELRQLTHLNPASGVADHNISDNPVERTRVTEVVDWVVTTQPWLFPASTAAAHERQVDSPERSDFSRRSTRPNRCSGISSILAWLRMRRQCASPISRRNGRRNNGRQ